MDKNKLNILVFGAGLQIAGSSIIDTLGYGNNGMVESWVWGMRSNHSSG